MFRNYAFAIFEEQVYIIDLVDRTETDAVGNDADDTLVAMTDAEPTSLQHEVQLSLKDFIIGYPTQTGL